MLLGQKLCVETLPAPGAWGPLPPLIASLFVYETTCVCVCVCHAPPTFITWTHRSCIVHPSTLTVLEHKAPHFTTPSLRAGPEVQSEEKFLPAEFRVCAYACVSVSVFISTGKALHSASDMLGTGPPEWLALGLCLSLSPSLFSFLMYQTFS